MPRRRPTFDPPPALFGSEYDALSRGYAELGKRNALAQGYTNAATASNRLLLADTKNAYLVADLNSPHGRLARAMTQPDLFDAYGKELTDKLPGATRDKLHHDISRAMGIKRGQKIADGLPFRHTLSLRNDTLFVAYAAAARTAAAPAHNQALTIV